MEEEEEQGSMSSIAQPIKNRWREIFDTALKTQLSDFQKLGLTIGRNQVAQAVRDVVGMGINFVLDTTRDIRVRVEVLDSMIGWLYTFYGAKMDGIARDMLREWHYIVHHHWYSSALLELNDRIASGSSEYFSLPLTESEIREIATTYAEKHILPLGRDMVAIAFDEKLYTAEFVALIQSMIMAGTAQPPEREHSLGLFNVAQEQAERRRTTQ
jgi:hypothetical protein